MKNITVEKRSQIIDMKRINKKWDEISGCVAEAFRMTEDETRRFKEKNIAKLIGTLPFLAGCEDAERTAVTHLGTYILSLRETKPYFNAKTEDNSNIFERLRLGTSFKGGNPGIIEKGMSILALFMLEDYRRDTHLDNVLGKYNPVTSGAFDYDAVSEDLLKKIRSIESPEIDTIVCSDPGTLDYWGY